MTFQGSEQPPTYLSLSTIDRLTEYETVDFLRFRQKRSRQCSTFLPASALKSRKSTLSSCGRGQGEGSDPGFPFSKWTTNLIKGDKSPDGRGFGCEWGGAEEGSRWVRRKNGPFSSRLTVPCGSSSRVRE